MEHRMRAPSCCPELAGRPELSAIVVCRLTPSQKKLSDRMEHRYGLRAGYSLMFLLVVLGITHHASDVIHTQLAKSFAG
jgi:hypothetical protein